MLCKLCTGDHLSSVGAYNLKVFITDNVRMAYSSNGRLCTSIIWWIPYWIITTPLALLNADTLFQTGAVELANMGFIQLKSRILLSSLNFALFAICRSSGIFETLNASLQVYTYFWIETILLWNLFNSSCQSRIIWLFGFLFLIKITKWKPSIGRWCAESVVYEWTGSVFRTIHNKNSIWFFSGQAVHFKVSENFKSVLALV